MKGIEKTIFSSSLHKIKRLFPINQTARSVIKKNVFDNFAFLDVQKNNFCDFLYFCGT